MVASYNDIAWLSLSRNLISLYKIKSTKTNCNNLIFRRYSQCNIFQLYKFNSRILPSQQIFLYSGKTLFFEVKLTRKIGIQIEDGVIDNIRIDFLSWIFKVFLAQRESIFSFSILTRFIYLCTYITFAWKVIQINNSQRNWKKKWLMETWWLNFFCVLSFVLQFASPSHIVWFCVLA